MLLCCYKLHLNYSFPRVNEQFSLNCEQPFPRLENADESAIWDDSKQKYKPSDERKQIKSDFSLVRLNKNLVWWVKCQQTSSQQNLQRVWTTKNLHLDIKSQRKREWTIWINTLKPLWFRFILCCHYILWSTSCSGCKLSGCAMSVIFFLLAAYHWHQLVCVDRSMSERQWSHLERISDQTFTSSFTKSH